MVTLTIALLLAMSPYQARQRPLGSTVTIDAYVTVASGVFSSFMGDNGFVLGNNVTGIYVATDKKSYHSLGSALEVRGTLADNGHGLLILKAREINLKKGRSLVRPQKVTPNEIDELHEGHILQIEGELTRPPQSDLPAGHKLYLRQTPTGPEVQIFLPTTVPPDPALLTKGRHLKITGFCAQYDQTYELIVRTPKDIQPSK